MKRCAACGHENDDWRPFCTRCSASFAGPAAAPVLGPPPSWAGPPPALPGTPDTGTRRAPAAPRAAAGPGAPTAPGSPRRRSPALVALTVVVAVAVVAGASVAFTQLGSDHHASAPRIVYPSVWDSRVTDLVQFDSAKRNLAYKHPVKVTFLSEAAFKKRVTTDDSKLTAQDRRYLQNALESLRAMGMVQGKVDLFAKANQLSGATVLAFYDPEKKEVVVPGSRLDVEQRVTLAHELTHTLDDQHFDLSHLRKIGDQHDTDAVTALIEGDARWVESLYIAGLSAADRRAYVRSQQTQVSPGALEGVPKIFEVLEQWPYDFGPQLVSILHKQGGSSRVDAAFRSPPIDEEQVIDPISYLDGDQPGPISAPALPSGAKKLDSGKEFGALVWYLVLSEHIDAHVALKAALGWGADAYTDAREGNRTCVEIHYRGETRHDNAEMMTALRQWIAALPKGMATVKANKDDTLSLHSCDPGATAKVVTDRSTTAYQLLVFRGQLIEEIIKAGSTPEVATCAADAVTDQASVVDIAAGQPPPVLSNPSALARIGARCRATAHSVVAPDQIDK